MNSRVLFWFLFVSAGVVYLSSMLLTRGHFTIDMLEADEREYYNLATTILDGSHEFHPRRVIGPPLFLAGIRSLISDHYLAVQICSTLVFAFVPPLVYLLVRRTLGNDKAAVTAGLLAMFWPPFIYYGGTLYSESLALPMVLAFLLVFPDQSSLVGSRSRRLRCWIGAGAMLGLCMHIRPMYLLYAPIAAVLTLRPSSPQSRTNWARPLRRRMIHAGMLTAGCLLVVMPWSILQSLRANHFILLSSNGDETLSGGLNSKLIQMRENSDQIEAPSGRSSWIGPGKWLPPSESGYLDQTERNLPYVLQSKLLQQRSIAWMIESPGFAAYLTFRKLAYMWGIYPFWNGWNQTLLGNIPLMILMLAAVLSLFRLRQFFFDLALFWSLPIFSSLVALISWGSWRFRQPGDIGLIILAAALPWIPEIKAHFLGRNHANPLEKRNGVELNT